MKQLRSLLALIVLTPVATAIAADLSGSRASLLRANKVARKSDYTFLRTSAEVRAFVKKEHLETVTSTPDYAVNNVMFPYARPAVKLFLERLGAEYRAVTGERLVVTSLTRPLSRQPRNASRLSVHPTGMAVDLRVPKSKSNRMWLERTLLALEDNVVLDVTLERHPAHYHVAVFPREYERFVANLTLSGR